MKKRKQESDPIVVRVKRRWWASGPKMKAESCPERAAFEEGQKNVLQMRVARLQDNLGVPSWAREQRSMGKLLADEMYAKMVKELAKEAEELPTPKEINVGAEKQLRSCVKEQPTLNVHTVEAIRKLQEYVEGPIDVNVYTPMAEAYNAGLRKSNPVPKWEDMKFEIQQVLLRAKKKGEIAAVDQFDHITDPELLKQLVLLYEEVYGFTPAAIVRKMDSYDIHNNVQMTTRLK